MLGDPETDILPPIFESSVKKDQNYGHSKCQLRFSLPNPLWDALCPHDPISFHKSLCIPNVLLISEKRETIQDSYLLNLSLIKLKLTCLQST